MPVQLVVKPLVKQILLMPNFHFQVARLRKDYVDDVLVRLRKRPQFDRLLKGSHPVIELSLLWYRKPSVVKCDYL